MARSWSGFLPQNQDIKEQWGMLEQDQSDVQVQIQLVPADVEEGDDYPDPGTPVEIVRSD